MRATALVVAAGSGERLGADRPKALVVLAGKPMLQWSLEAIEAAPSIDRIVLALPPTGVAASGIGIEPVRGGRTRSESVRNALQAAGDVERVVVHDAARPLVSPELFERTLAALDNADAAIAAIPVVDTIKEVGARRVVYGTPDRNRLWAVQTPQAFRADVLRAALDQPEEVLGRATDDASLVEGMGGSVIVVQSTPENFKVTTPHDLRVAEFLLQSRSA